MGDPEQPPVDRPDINSLAPRTGSPHSAVTDHPESPVAAMAEKVAAGGERGYKFFENSPILSTEEVVETLARWEAIEPVESKGCAVGVLDITPAELGIVKAAVEQGRGGRFDIDFGPLPEELGGLNDFADRFREIVLQDILRGGMQGRLSVTCHIANHNPTYGFGATMPHIDGAGEPWVAWLTSIGIGSTVVYRGRQTSPARRPANAPEPEFTPVYFPDNAVVRINRSTDVHSSPDQSKGTGPRAVFSADLKLNEPSNLSDFLLRFQVPT